MPINIIDLILDLPLWRKEECRYATQKILAEGSEPYYILEAMNLSDEVIEQVTKNLPKTPREFFDMDVEERLAWAQKTAPSVNPLELTTKFENAVRTFVGRAVENYWVNIGFRFKREPADQG